VAAEEFAAAGAQVVRFLKREAVEDLETDLGVLLLGDRDCAVGLDDRGVGEM
jgi:hypothetical protein